MILLPVDQTFLREKYRAIAPASRGRPTVMQIMTKPSALISGLTELRSIPKIWVGTVSIPDGRQKMVAVMLSNEIVKAKSAPAKTAGINSGSVISKNVWSGEAPSDRAASS